MVRNKVKTHEDIVLKQAVAAELDLTFAIKKSAGGEYIQNVFGWDEQVQIEFHKKQFSPDNTDLIVRNGTVVGWISVFDHVDHVKIEELSVLREFQNMGIGTSVLLQAIEHARRRNATLCLRVFGVNRAGIRLYKRHGLQRRDEDGPFLHMELFPSSETKQGGANS